MSKRRNGKRNLAKPKEQRMGLQGTTAEGLAKAFDFFTNLAARTGFGTPSLTEATQYELVRFSYNYWELITLYRNHWISRRIVDSPATDMVRAWPRLTSEIDPEGMTKIDRAIRHHGVRRSVLRALQWGRLFGGAGCLIVLDGQEDELDQPIEFDKLELGSFRGLIPFDRWSSIQPESVGEDINRPGEFNNPQSYRVSTPNAESFSVHASRILRFCGPMVPTPEYQAQNWWGISVLEPVYEEIRKRDNMSWNILSLTFRANILGMKFPQLAQMMSGLNSSQMANQQFSQRMSEINHLISNQSLLPLPADGGLESTQYSFSGLSECYQQFQLDISGAAQIPVSRLWGRTISGLGQSNDADERMYEEKIASDQEDTLRAPLEQLYAVLCASELGEVPDDLDLNFPSIRVLDEQQKSELAKATTDTVTVLMNGGIMSPRTAAKEIKQSSDLTGVGTNLTDEEIEALSDKTQPEGELGAGLFGEEGSESLNPSSSPDRVLKEQTKEAEGKAEDEDNFEESEHPRDEGGQFASKRGTGGGANAEAAEQRERPSTTTGSAASAALKQYSSREEWPEHIKALKLPPAWKNVRVSTDPDSALQAIGRDAKGRPQYVYSASFKATQAALKFDRIAALHQEASLVDGQLRKGRESTDANERDHAECATLIRKMGIRPGSDRDTKAKEKAYGATTLEGRHVVVGEDQTVRLQFTGKKGVKLDLPVTDRALANDLLQRKSAAGDAGRIYGKVTSDSLLDHVHKLDHGGFKPKDFRTSLATSTAEELVSADNTPPKNEKEYRKRVLGVAKQVAAKLGNTPTVALQSYIAPQVFAPWRVNVG